MGGLHGLSRAVPLQLDPQAISSDELSDWSGDEVGAEPRSKARKQRLLGLQRATGLPRAAASSVLERQAEVNGGALPTFSFLATQGRVETTRVADQRALHQAVQRAEAEAKRIVYARHLRQRKQVEAIAASSSVARNVGVPK